jgi:hypothetical protein
LASAEAGALLAELLQLRADSGRVGVVQVVEDGQCLLPGILSPLRIAGCVAGVAEVGEGSGLAVVIAQVPDDIEGVLVMCCRFVQATELMFSVAEAIPGVCLAIAVAEIAVQGQGLLAERPGPLVVAE